MKTLRTQSPKSSTLTILTACLLLNMIACGPTFRTNYLFTPPDSTQGQACIFQCENSQAQCEQIEDLQKDSCEQRAELEKDRCEREFRREGKKPKWYDCGSSSCTSDYEKCEERYRRCYQSCGGQVKSETVCVSGCEQLNVAPVAQ